MKRLNNLYEKVYDLNNIELADNRARKHKSTNYGVLKHDKDRGFENLILHLDLRNLEYKTSEYSTFFIHEPKEREIFRLPYYPDRICHHAIMNIMEPIWVKKFIDQTYSCIKERGIHKVNKDLSRVLKQDKEGTKYCLKMDIRKFYPSINHDDLKRIIRRGIKDLQMLYVLDEIIDSAPGVPIGNYLSQYFANLYLTYFDHWLKEEVKVKYYFRYADDMVILSDDKDFLHNVLCAIKLYLNVELHLELKGNYQIFPVRKRGIDFVGYKFYGEYTLLRKSIKKDLFKLIKNNPEDLKERICSYFGWMKYCNSKHLMQKVEKLSGIHLSNFNGRVRNITSFYNKNIYIVEVIAHNKYYEIHFIYKKHPYIVRSSNIVLFEIINNSKTNWKSFHLNRY